MLHLAIGAKALSISEIWLAISAFNSNNFDHMIVWNIRLPRALIAITVGASLAVAGAIMQGVNKKPTRFPQYFRTNKWRCICYRSCAGLVRH